MCSNSRTRSAQLGEYYFIRTGNSFWPVQTLDGELCVCALISNCAAPKRNYELRYGNAILIRLNLHWCVSVWWETMSKNDCEVRHKTDHVHPTRLTWHTISHTHPIHIAYKVYADWLHILIHAFGGVPIWLSFNLRSSSLLLFFFSFPFLSFYFVGYCCWLLAQSVHVLCVRSVNVDLFKFSVKPWAYMLRHSIVLQMGLVGFYHHLWALIFAFCSLHPAKGP